MGIIEARLVELGNNLPAPRPVQQGVLARIFGRAELRDNLDSHQRYVAVREEMRPLMDEISNLIYRANLP